MSDITFNFDDKECNPVTLSIVLEECANINHDLLEAGLFENSNNHYKHLIHRISLYLNSVFPNQKFEFIIVNDKNQKVIFIINVLRYKCLDPLHASYLYFKMFGSTTHH